MAVNGGHAGTKKGPNWGHVTKIRNGQNEFWRARFQTSNSVSFRSSPSSGGENSVSPLGLLFVCQSELTEFYAEPTEFVPKLSEAQ